ncbi:MAG: hypothetical protein LBJ00_18425 [Planctomycetaceae bacterium]|nr:hypothetical protein [Planctomycetaceae bacterium]
MMKSTLSCSFIFWVCCYTQAVLSWTRKRNNVKRLFKGEAYRLTGYGIQFIAD